MRFALNQQYTTDSSIIQIQPMRFELFQLNLNQTAGLMGNNYIEEEVKRRKHRQF